jgi:hypothetical protein
METLPAALLEQCLEQVPLAGRGPLFAVSRAWRRAARSITAAVSTIGALDVPAADQFTQLPRLSNLQAAWLSGQKALGDAALEALGSCAKLETLDVSRCHRLTDAGVLKLCGTTSLREVDLTHCEGVSYAAVLARAANSGGPRGPTGPLRTASRTP